MISDPCLVPFAALGETGFAVRILPWSLPNNVKYQQTWNLATMHLPGQKNRKTFALFLKICYFANLT